MPRSMPLAAVAAGRRRGGRPGGRGGVRRRGAPGWCARVGQPRPGGARSLHAPAATIVDTTLRHLLRGVGSAERARSASTTCSTWPRPRPPPQAAPVLARPPRRGGGRREPPGPAGGRHHGAATPPGPLEASVSETCWPSSQATATRLRSVGVTVVDAPVSRFPSACVGAYLRLKSVARLSSHPRWVWGGRASTIAQNVAPRPMPTARAAGVLRPRGGDVALDQAGTAPAAPRTERQLDAGASLHRQRLHPGAVAGVAPTAPSRCAAPRARPRRRATAPARRGGRSTARCCRSRPGGWRSRPPGPAAAR